MCTSLTFEFFYLIYTVSLQPIETIFLDGSAVLSSLSPVELH
jgi:hypothetical protein